MNNPEISVCLPVWNGEKYLVEAIESVQKQSLRNFELILSDDSSTDNSLRIIESIAKNDERIHVLPHQGIRGGLFENYNRCMRHSTAPIVKLFAQDDLLDSRHLESVVATFARHSGVALISTGKTIIGQSGNSIDGIDESLTVADFFNESLRTDFVGGLPISEHLIEGDLVNNKILSDFLNFIGEPCTVSIRREALGDLFDNNFFHMGDLEYWIRVFEFGSFCFLPEKLTSFRRHEESATSFNISNLLFATDLLLMMDKHRDLSTKLGINLVSQERQLISSLSAFVYTLDIKEIIKEEYLDSKDSLPRISQSNRGLESEYLVVRRLLFKTLKQLAKKEGFFSQAPKTGLEVRKRQSLIEEKENSIRKLLGSKSWKLTKLLREGSSSLLKQPEMNRQTLPGSTEIEKTTDLEVMYDGRIPPELSDSQQSINEGAVLDQIQEQTKYLEYLTNMEQSILSSRSWKVTSVLRKLGIDRL